MLKLIAPALTHVALMYNPETYGFYDAYLQRFQDEARWPIELTRAAVRVPADIDTVIADIAEWLFGILKFIASVRLNEQESR